MALDMVCDYSRKIPTVAILIGLPMYDSDSPNGAIYNSVAMIQNGKVLNIQRKTLLPTYDVFNEARYFKPATDVDVFKCGDETLGVSICEDFWNDPALWPRSGSYTTDPVATLAKKGATLMVNLSASPYNIGKEKLRRRLISDHAKRHGTPFLFVNQVGGNDELIFDGRSMLFDRKGRLVYAAPAFREHVETIDTNMESDNNGFPPQDEIEAVFDALSLGLEDYMRKCGFSKTVVGLSGGIDSAVSLCLAVSALGPRNTLGIGMPSRYSSPESVTDARKLAENLGVEFKVVPIEKTYSSYLDSLGSEMDVSEVTKTEENIQARIRGNILMAFSNKFGSLVLSTGNKSELAIGYCTLYGDMSGGVSVLGDVPKTKVFELAKYINRNSEVIPRATIERAPSAELRPNQKDQDTLPPYEILDKILYLFVEENLCRQEIVEMGYDDDTVKWILSAVDSNEYKRRQSALSFKVTTRSFGIGRRMPIAARTEC